MVPYRTPFRFRAVPYYITIPYGTVPYRTVLYAYGQRKYMTHAGIELASPSLNTADSQKFLYRKKCWAKVLEWTTPTLLAKSVGVGHPNTVFPTLFGNLLSESAM
jgi:hypothetical protein